MSSLVAAIHAPDARILQWGPKTSMLHTGSPFLFALSFLFVTWLFEVVVVD
jgi:hypothetical protein